jgi:HK97 family phage prohead protease
MTQQNQASAWDFKAPTMANFLLADPGADPAVLGSFAGYLAVFGNQDSNDDVIEPGAFAKTLSEYRMAGAMPPMLLNHAGIPFGAVTTTSLLPIGVWTEMVEDSKGLAVKGRLDPMDTDLGKQIYAGLRNRTVKGLSIGFTATEFKRGTKADGPNRFISALKLYEGSIVWSPGNPLANVDSVKSSLDAILHQTRQRLGIEIFDIKNVRHIDTLLREAGMSRSEAKATLARGFKSSMTTPREAGATSALDGLLAELRSVNAGVAQ